MGAQDLFEFGVAVGEMLDFRPQIVSLINLAPRPATIVWIWGLGFWVWCFGILCLVLVFGVLEIGVWE